MEVGGRGKTKLITPTDVDGFAWRWGSGLEMTCERWCEEMVDMTWSVVKLASSVTTCKDVKR